MTLDKRKQDLQKIWQAAVASVSGEQSVTHAIENDDAFEPDQVIAVGKAAVGMCRGALGYFPACNALVVTKYEHADEDILSRENVRVIESAHPIPDQQSLDAGKALLECVTNMAPNTRLLLLVSGGASALAESLVDNMSLLDLQAATDEMISGGKTIGEINTRRKAMSQIKDGKLLAVFAGAEARVYAISDVEGDNIDTIGSGIGDCRRAIAPARSTIVASNQIARERACQAAQALGYLVRHNDESLYDDVFRLAPIIGNQLSNAEPGVYIWGGEPTVILPKNPGRGGRNQALALATSEHLLNKENINLLVAGTDGSDGPTTAAGGLVDCNTFSDYDAAKVALEAANAGTYLEQHDSLFVTGPTNTNVMDLAIAIVE